MSFAWRLLTKEDLPMLRQWWDDWGWEACPTIEMLPQDAFLVFNTESGIPVYAGFLYSTGTVMGWVEYVVSNKHADVSQKRGGLQYLMSVIGVIAKYKGITTLFTSTVMPSFVQSLKKCGFSVGDTGNYQLIKKL